MTRWQIMLKLLPNEEQMWNTEYLVAMSRSFSLLITMKADYRKQNDDTMTLPT